MLVYQLYTNPLIREFYKNSEYGPHVAGQQPEQQLAWLDKILTASTAQWKIVVGHHPVYTAGPRTENYDTFAVRKVLEPILVKHQVPVYLSGHEHSMQDLKVDDKPSQQFISGSGSEVTPVKKISVGELIFCCSFFTEMFRRHLLDWV